MQREFRRVAIVNRGEAAMRFINAAREFNREHRAGLRTIALFTEPDRHAMFVREADEAVPLGPAQVADPATQQLRSSYVDYGRLGRALGEARAEAVWVGWGFAAEHAAFADLCREIGIVFIGPDGDVMRLLGDKISSKQLAEQAGIPVAPWSGGPVDTIDSARHYAELLSYPFLIKATAGGGGHGIRRVDGPTQLEKAFESARAEAFKAFGDPTVFMEKLVRGARHVEVQIIADLFGTTWAAGVRDCSIQRRHQKVVEEAPSPVLSHAQDRALREAAIRLSQAARYNNAGTVEFLYDPASAHYWFMEMNTRLQVEHPVTECTTGLDLVKLQIHVARGGRLHGEPPPTTGHAIEVRLNAEDPDNGFAPAPGVIERFRIQAGPGVRIDTGVAEGDSVPAEFDSMIAKIIGYGRTREEALSRVHRAVRDSVVIIRDGTSNKAALLAILDRPELLRGEADIHWLDRLAASGQHVSRRDPEIALVQAAIEAYSADLSVEQAQFYASALRGRPVVRTEFGRTVELRYRGNQYHLSVYRRGLQQYRVLADGARIDAAVDRLGEFEYWLNIRDRRFHVVSVPQGRSYRIEVDGVSHRIDRDDGGLVRSPAPAVVVSIAVKPGDMVSIGDPIAVLEAMKMEMPVMAPFSGRIRQVLTIPYVQVATGAPLVQIEPAESSNAEAGGPRVSFTDLATESAGSTTLNSCVQTLDELRRLVLGFDIDAKSLARSLSEWSRSGETRADADEIAAREDEILSTFVDIRSLFQREPEVDGPTGAEAPSAEANLFAYLRMLDTQGERLPASFIGALRRALAHYGLQSLERSAELEETLLRICKSHERVEEQTGPVVTLLEGRLRRVGAFGPPADDSQRVLLDRMISTTRGVLPAISDLAGEVRYRCCDRPLFERARAQAYAEAEEHLAYLAACPEALDRHDRIRALLDCPQPLVGLFSRRAGGSDAAARELMTEVLTARYYRIRALTDLRCVAVGDYCFARGEYDYLARRIHVLATFADYARLPESLDEAAALLSEVPADRDVVLDFYTYHSSSPGTPDAVQEEVRSAVNRTAFPRTIRRVVVTVTIPSGGMLHFTYRPSAEGFEEQKLYRGIHPMIAKRMHFWRLENFDIERLASAEDVYLLHAVARHNPKDERLFACAEVRDLTGVRDETGRVVELPHMERMFTEAAAAIRLFQSRRSARERLYWNRILLYLWPVLDVSPEELDGIVHKLAPVTEGLGLEQVVLRARVPNPATGELRDMVIRIWSPAGAGLVMTFRPAANLQPLKPLSEYTQKVVRMRQRGLVYPYEIIRMLTPSAEDSRAEFPPGDFVEHDLASDGRLTPVDRPYGGNKANIVAGIIRNFTRKYPEGMNRVLLLGDPSKDLGALGEPECRRILAAIDLAEEMRVPLEWFPISAGARISMDSGVENMDWIARVLRRLIQFTQGGGEVNLIVTGINVGAQPYWNAEATMLMHTRGILVMTPAAAMVLTGKRALDYSGSISAEDNQGIGGYDRVMGPNGQAQYWARDTDDACRILLRHYDHSYRMAGERFPRPAATTDPVDRDVRTYPHPSSRDDGFASVGEIFSDETNPGRKKSFDIRRVMVAVSDQDHAPLERWAGMRAAETSVVWDVHLGGNPVCLIGIESRPVPRLGFVPADGPDQWCAGTLFPLSSKKVARAINAASDNRPVVLLANLSGFDGSPESLRHLQLEYGAEIGRAVVNFKGPMVFCVISRYHGGAYVVFSSTLNENLEVAALEGTYASVIGGAPAAAVVFAGEVESRTRSDPRLRELSAALAAAEGVEKGRLRTQWNDLFKIVHSEKLGQMADEFDSVHTVQRALQVGALHHIIPPARLRPYLIDAVQRGMAKVESEFRDALRRAGTPVQARAQAAAAATGSDGSHGRVLVRTDAGRLART